MTTFYAIGSGGRPGRLHPDAEDPVWQDLLQIRLHAAFSHELLPDLEFLGRRIRLHQCLHDQSILYHTVASRTWLQGLNARNLGTSGWSLEQTAGCSAEKGVKTI